MNLMQDFFNLTLGRPKPGLYKAKLAKNTIIKIYPEYNEVGDVLFSLEAGGNISETKDGVGLMGLTQNIPGKKRYYSIKELNNYFDFVE